MKHPLVSVVVATYHRDASLKNALESLATQTYQAIEIVLVDDNADDSWNQKVSAIVQLFYAEHPYILFQYIVNQNNQGSAKTRNIGINSANGEFVTFLDDDDLYMPEKIKCQINSMIEAKSDYCLTDLYLYNEDDKLIDRRIRNYIKQENQDDLLQYHLLYHMTGTDTMMFKKIYLEKIGGFPPIDVGDEFYLMKEAIAGGGTFNYLPVCDVKAYVHTETGGVSSGDGKIKGENDLFDYKKQFFCEMAKKNVRYIKMRHYAVIAFAEIRRRRYCAFLQNAVMSFFISPRECLKLLRERV